MEAKMNLDDGKTDQVTKLGLPLGYPSVHSQKVVENDPSAGANAGSLSFVAANPVSELVWSPQGLTLKCAECSFTDKRLSLLWDVGSSNSVLSTPQVEEVDCRNIASTKENMVAPEGIPDSENGTSRKNVMVEFPVYSLGKGPNEVYRDKNTPDVRDPINGDRKNNLDLLNQAQGTLKTREESSFAFPDRNIGRTIKLLRNAPTPGDCNSDEQASSSCSKKQAMEIPLDAEISPLNNDNAFDAGILSCSLENDQVGNLSIPLSQKIESTDENDIRGPDSENASGVAMDSAASESSSEVKGKSMHGMENHLEKLIPPGNHSPRVLPSHSKGKERELSDGDADKRLLKEKNDSNESAESCNSAIWKRSRFDQQLFVSGKKAKQIHNQPASSGQDSSFMMWISSMMKGLSRSNLDAGTPLSISNGPENVIHTHKSEQNMRYTGFKSFIQSIYQTSQNAQEVGLPIAFNQAKIESSLAKGVNEVCSVSADPTPHYRGTENESKQLLLSKKEFTEDISDIGAGPSSLPSVVYTHVTITKEESKAYSGENKGSIGKDALITSSLFALEHKTMKAESPEEKATEFANKGDPLGSLWISRFSSKTYCSSFKLDEATQGLASATDGSHNSERALVHFPRSCGFQKNPVNAASDKGCGERPVCAAGKELANCPVGTESSVGFTRAESYHEEETARKVDVMLPSECLKSSEEMASTFARRLDALRQNFPLKANDDVKPTVSCCFCGMMGQQIRLCTKVAKTEFQGLVNTVHPYEAPKTSSPICIKCFQFNHRAVSCPHKQFQVHEQDGFSFWVGHGCSDEVSLQNEQTVRKNHHGKGSGNLKRKAVSASGMLTSIRKDDGISISINQNNQTESTAGCDFFIEKISEVPQGIFDTVKMLRLSRADILKWMNSDTSLIHLDGYFLRLRLGKGEEGLGGSGYYAARISGMMQEDRLPGNGKIFISVNVGGVKCLVGSQYISNHDFLEDELLAWWYTTSKEGGKIPSEEDLKSKVEERRRLGF